MTKVPDRSLPEKFMLLPTVRELVAFFWWVLTDRLR
jgi:hypothetical protein